MVFSFTTGMLGWKFKAFPLISFLAKGLESVVGCPAEV
jgi:hypothetical protein